jgi:hypothetical protein
MPTLRIITTPGKDVGGSEGIERVNFQCQPHTRNTAVNPAIGTVGVTRARRRGGVVSALTTPARRLSPLGAALLVVADELAFSAEVMGAVFARRHVIAHTSPLACVA